MNENIYSKLRYPRLVWIIFFGFVSIIFDVGTYRIINGLGTDSVFGFIIILAITMFTNYIFIKNIIYFANPNINPIAKKYGGIENLKKIVKEINKTTVYKDGWIVVSNNYISYVKNYKKIVHLDNVINAYQQIVRTNGFLTRRYIVIIDVNGKKIEYACSNNEEKVLKALTTLSILRDDIKMGYTI